MCEACISDSYGFIFSPELRVELVRGPEYSCKVFQVFQLRHTLLSGTGVKGQAIILGRERDGRALGKEEDITRLGLHFVARLVRNGILTCTPRSVLLDRLG